MSVADMHANEAQRLLAFCEHPPKWISGVAVEPDPEAIDSFTVLPGAMTGTVDVTPALAAAQVHAALAVEARVAEGNALLRDLIALNRGNGVSILRNRRRD